MWLTGILACLVMGVLPALQGIKILRKKQTQYFWLGIAALAIALLGLLCCVLFLPYTIVISPEFNVVLVEGSAARWALSALLLGISLAAALVWHALRTAFGYPSRLHWLWLAGLAAGIWAVLMITVLNGDSEATIYSYSLISPPFILWLVLCSLEILFMVVRIRSVLARGLLGTALGGAAGLWIANQAVPPASLHLIRFWQKASWTVLPLGAVWFAWAVTWLFRTGTLTFLQVTKRRVLETASAALVALVITFILAWKYHAQISYKWIAVALGLWLASAVIAVVPMVLEGYRKFRSGTLKNVFKVEPSMVEAGILVLVFTQIFSMADMFFFGLLRPLTDLQLFCIGWFLLIEIIVGRTILAVLEHPSLSHIWSAQSPALALVASSGGQIKKGFGHVSKFLQGVFNAGSVPTAILKTFAGIAILIFLAELPDSGKLVIQPLNDKSLACSGEKAGPDKEAGCEKELGHSISEQVANRLGLLGRELQPEVTVFLGKENKTVVLNASSGGLEAEVKQELKIGDTAIPLGLLQNPARHLFGIQIISGSVQKKGCGFVLLAGSSTGGNWQASSPDKCPSPQDSSTAAARLAEELAYKIMVSQPSLLNMGNTSSWEALAHFCSGLAAWHKVEGSSEDYEDVTTAIKEFQEAIKIDPRFALAYYKLGQALVQDHQPLSAIEAFRSSVEANADFVAGRLQLAQTLYDFDTYKMRLPEAMAASPWDSQEKADAQRNLEIMRREEARRYWESVVARSFSRTEFTDRAAAYFGLCRYSYDKSINPFANVHDRDMGRYLAYYYCKRAEGLYSMLPPQAASDPDTKNFQAYAIATTGFVVDNTVDTGVESTQWQCNPYVITEVKFASPDSSVALPVHILKKAGPNTSRALRYYREALRLIPEDSYLRCKIAEKEAALGNVAPMAELQEDATTHGLLGRSLVDRVKYLPDSLTVPAYYRLALSEFERAVQLGPSSTDFMDDYAYTFWLWRLLWYSEKPPEGPDPAIAHRAEALARRALQLVRGKVSPAQEAQYMHTLGQVLLGQGRAEEALPLIEEAYNKSPKHALYNEIRWDLAKAYICVTENDLMEQLVPAERHDFWEKAAPKLKEIRELESSREDRPFTDVLRLLDPAQDLSVCLRKQYMIEQEPGQDSVRFALANSRPIYDHHAPCNWSGVWAEALEKNGQPAVGTFFLHLWGGEIDTRVVVDASHKQDIFLTSEPRKTHLYYAAQLEDDTNHPVSFVYPISTFANEGPNKCGRNEIHLKFTREVPLTQLAKR